jgi:septal ring factor EnvC (AmiA/AmiB activator)
MFAWAWAQDVPKEIRKLEAVEQQLENEVQKTEQLLQATKQNKRKSFNEIALLNKQIRLRSQLLGSINRQIETLEGEIAQIEAMVGAIEADIERYAASHDVAVRRAYVYSYDLGPLLWIFCSSGFEELFNRLLYYREIAKFRHNQIHVVSRTKKLLLQKKQRKQRIKAEKEFLLNKRIDEKKKLDAAKEDKDKLYRDLKRSEKEYALQVENYRKELRQIREDIKRIIAESRKAGMSEAEQKLSTVFAGNKGKLPWPVAMGESVVSEGFGKTINAAGNEVINDGIYFTTKPGQKVRAVFNGKVTMIGKVPSYGNVIILQHGKYRTVYANVENVTIKKDQEVAVLQELGTVKNDPFTGDARLYFQIYRDFNPVNPSVWVQNGMPN